MALLALWNPNIQFLKTDGTINAGGKLVVTDHNDAESIPANYSDADGTTLNPSPIVLDALGRATCYIDDASTYDLYVKDANGATLWTVSNLAPGDGSIIIRATGFEVSSADGTVDVAETVYTNGIIHYDLSVQDAINSAKTVIVEGDNITVTKTVGADGQDVYTIDGEGEDNLVEDVRVNGASVVTDKVANIDVPVAGTASPLMDGTASAGASGKYAREDHAHPSDTSREAVANKTTVVQGSSDSKYPTDKAVWNFVNSSIATNTAYYISDNGEPFTSVAQLEAYAGTVTNNDYAFVTGTDAAGNTYYDRYKATVSGSTVTWALEYRLNNSSFTSAQWAAINSGITSALVGKIHEHSNKAVLDGITATDVSNWNGKKDKQTAVTFTGSTLKTPTSMTQDANGAMAVTFTDIQSASTSQTGIVQLSDATNSTSTTLAATANAVKKAYDLASNAKPKQAAKSSPTASGSDIAFIDTISQDANGVTTATKKNVRPASATQSGVMSAEHFSKLESLPTASELQTELGGKADKVSDATAGDVATLDANGNLVDSGMTLGKSVPSDAVFTDTKVTQAKDDSGTTAYPLLMAGAANPNGTATTARYDSGVKLTPSTNTISANISGKAASADVASALDMNATVPIQSGAGISITSSETAVTVALSDSAQTSLGKADSALQNVKVNGNALPKTDNAVDVAVEGTYNASTNKIATVSSVTSRINALDATATSTDGTNVQVKVTETDGKVTAVNITKDDTEPAFSINYRASDQALVFSKAFGTNT